MYYIPHINNSFIKNKFISDTKAKYFPNLNVYFPTDGRGEHVNF